MKNIVFIFIAAACLISIENFAQNSGPLQMNSDDQNATLIAENNNDLAVVSYRVEERINMNFGGRITTYVVPNLNMVSTNDLGPNNSRRITPKYGKAKAIMPLNTIVAIAPINAMPSILNAIKIETPKLLVRKKYVNINFIDTYERVLEKGYKSADMLKRVANARFFQGDLEMAAKWYTELFSLSTGLEAEYYYRYAQALKSIHQIEKSDAMMLEFENKQ